MTILQIVFGGFLIVLLLGLACYYGWSQVKTLRGKVQAESSEERLYLRWQAWRRLVTSFLMLVLAGLLLGALVYLEEPAERLASQTEQSSQLSWTEEQRAFADLYTRYWIVFLLILLAVVALAGWDLWAIRRYRFAQLRQIQSDRREMLEEQAARIRRERLEAN